MADSRPHQARDPLWLYTTRYGLGVSWFLLLIAFATAWGVKTSDLRAPGVVSNEFLRWILGWTPSFAAGFGFPYVWPAIRSSFHRLGRSKGWGLGRTEFLPECLASALVVTAGELFDGLFPRIGHTAPQTFALSDLAAGVLGAGTALLVFRLLSRYGRNNRGLR